MIYLDYSATTPVDERLLEYFSLVSKEYYGNPNSKHRLGQASLQAIKESTRLVKSILNLKDQEILYTSGATEANNLAIKGYAHKNQSSGKHLIVSPYEHSSVVACFSALEKEGFLVDVLPSRPDGLVSLKDLAEMIQEDTILVSVCALNSELGILQDLKSIGEFLIKYPKIAFHVDATQAVGKIVLDYDLIDMFSFAAHKFYGLKGIGALVKNPKIKLDPIISGGSSLSNERAGTPATSLILSLSKSLELAYSNIEQKYEHVLQLKNYLVGELSRFENVYFNSNSNSIPHIVNVSIFDYSSVEVQRILNNHEIYVSTQSACVANQAYSHVIYRVTGDEKRAKTGFRISISYKTTLDEIIEFVDCLRGELLK